VGRLRVVHLVRKNLKCENVSQKTVATWEFERLVNTTASGRPLSRSTGCPDPSVGITGRTVRLQIWPFKVVFLPSGCSSL